VLGLAAAARGAGRLRGLYPAKTVATEMNVGPRVAADLSHGGDDDDGDQSADETIFDGRNAGLIADKAMEQITHD
jgi:hypothetical protein